MKKKLFGGIVALAFICLFTSIVSAQTVNNSWYIQHRLYESGRDIYRLSFSLLDCSSGTCIWLLGPPIVDRVEIWQSDDDQSWQWSLVDSYTTASGAIFPSDEIYSYENYDTTNVRWNFLLTDGNLTRFHEYYYNVNLTQIPTDKKWYQIQVYITGQSAPLISTNLFYLRSDTLPMLHIKSVKSTWDKDGNWIITWDPPYAYEPLVGYDPIGNPVYRPSSVRMFVYLADATPELQYFLGRVPTHMGYLFVPKDIVDQLKDWQKEVKAKKVELQLQVRTNDNQNRTYTDTVMVKLK